MFMAILNDTYSETKEDVENRREDFQVTVTFIAKSFIFSIYLLLVSIINQNYISILDDGLSCKRIQ